MNVFISNSAVLRRPDLEFPTRSLQASSIHYSRYDPRCADCVVGASFAKKVG